MSPLLIALLTIFGPLLVKGLELLIKKWLERAEKKVKSKIEKAETECEKAHIILDQAIEDSPRNKPGLRTFLRLFKRWLPVKGPLPKSLTKEVIPELKDAALSARRDG